MNHDAIKAVREMKTGHEKNLALLALLNAARGTITEAVGKFYTTLKETV